jgi:NitT/TauT family transport system substrate-binding protein
MYYVAYQGNIFGLAVPVESPVRSVADLRGRTIGVLSLGSSGGLVARALAAAHGLDPERDIRLAAVGQGAQAAALLRSRQVDALSQSDVQLALVEQAGMPLRRLDTPEIRRFPSDGFVALDETLATRRREAVGVARAYAKGTILALANPALAVRLLHEAFPDTLPTGVDRARAEQDARRVLGVRLEALMLERSGVARWGEASTPALAAYLDLLGRWGALKRPVAPSEVYTGELLAEINRIDAAAIAGAARRAPADP